MKLHHKTIELAETGVCANGGLAFYLRVLFLATRASQLSAYLPPPPEK